MRPVINTDKHIVQQSQFTVAAGALSQLTIISAVAAPAAGNEVRVGSVITAVFVEMWVSSDNGVASTGIVTLEKLPGSNNAGMSAADSAALNVYDNKKNVLHIQMGLLPNDLTYPMASVKGWFKIPKGKQRFGLDDRLMLNIHAQTTQLVGCGFFTYKEQF